MSERLQFIQNHIANTPPRDVFIVAAKRTPIGGYMGSLSSLTAP